MAKTDSSRKHAGGRPRTPEVELRLLEQSRSRGRYALRRGTDRLSEYLEDDRNPVDKLYLETFRELADRCGLPRRTEFEVEGDAVPRVDRATLSALVREHAQMLNGNGLVPEDPPFDASAPNGGVH